MEDLRHELMSLACGAVFRDSHLKGKLQEVVVVETL
jgi:hypothetical protein